MEGAWADHSSRVIGGLWSRTAKGCGQELTMKYLTRLTMIIFALFVLMAVIGLFLPTTWHVERSQVIEATPAHIHPLVNRFENWKQWAVLFRRDNRWTIHTRHGFSSFGTYYR